MFIGISNGTTGSGKKLKDGGTCIIVDEEIKVAVSEERITRVKHEGGFKNSLSYCLESLNGKLIDFEKIFTSSCCEYKPITNHSDVSPLLSSIGSISHHYSHAIGAYFCSDFDSAIIVVMDGGGNTLENDSLNWWECKREQTSIYLGQGNKIRLIERYFSEPYQVGYGEAFRYATKFLGFGNTENAGKVMALATLNHAKYHLALPNLFDNLAMLKNEPSKPVAKVKEMLANYNILIDERIGDEGFSIEQIGFAEYIQSSYQDHLVKIVSKHMKQHNIKNVCLSGGVALNCSANSYLLNNTHIESLFVQPAASDTGQCIGNAIFAYLDTTNKDTRFSLNNCYLGTPYGDATEDLKKIVNDNSKKFKIVSELEKITLERAGKLLFDGNIVGLYQGRSEFGPRALGNRSVLGNPTLKNIKTFINEHVKNREPFMPLAASVLSEHSTEIFEDTASTDMVLAPKVKISFRGKIPAVLHNDYSCRAQLVVESENPFFYSLIEHFFRLSGVPVVINTSMNMRGEPIAETIKDAIDWFMKTPIQYLICENILIKKLIP